MIDLHWIFEDIVNLQCKLLSFESLHPETALDVALVVVFLENHSRTILFDDSSSSGSQSFVALSIISTSLINTLEFRRN